MRGEPAGDKPAGFLLWRHIRSESYTRIGNAKMQLYSNTESLHIFELLSLGEFGYFVSCLNKNCRSEVSRSLGIRQSDDQKAMMPQKLIYSTKDLRNAIAHNDVIFDARFRTSRIDKHLRNTISNATGVQNLSFDTVTDYLVLVVYQLELLGFSKSRMKHLISDYSDSVEKLRQCIPVNVFNQIIHTDNRQKMDKRRAYISS